MCMSSTVKVWCSGKHARQHPVWESYQWLPFSTNVQCSPSHSCSLSVCLSVSLSPMLSLSLCLLSLPHFLAASSLFPPTHRCLFLMQNSFNLFYRLLPTHAFKWISHYQTNTWLVGFFLQEKKNLTSSALRVLVKFNNHHLQRKLPEWFPLVPPNQG